MERPSHVPPPKPRTPVKRSPKRTYPQTTCNKRPISGDDGWRIDAVRHRTAAGRAQPFAAWHARASRLLALLSSHNVVRVGLEESGAATAVGPSR